MGKRKSRKAFQISLIILLSIGITFNIGATLKKDINLSSDHSTLESTLFQTAKVPCKDVENFGSGHNYARICVDDGAAYCEWEHYKLPATSGSCFFEAE